MTITQIDPDAQNMCNVLLELHLLPLKYLKLKLKKKKIPDPKATTEYTF